ncbi:hypothetical protein [Nocardioides sp. YR527]|uniref:hypothetical protein n=1 Tax=Nocardioides sp. YR527 TaxID=1881028 RepID=UPI00115F7D7E|nr:hypothetical protein [Nocardioides sp. YR527]
MELTLRGERLDRMLGPSPARLNDRIREEPWVGPEEDRLPAKQVISCLANTDVDVTAADAPGEGGHGACPFSIGDET